MSMVTHSIKRRDIIWATALVVVLSAIWVMRGAPADAVATPPGEGIDLVLVAVADNFPDALGVGPAAGAYGAPIILVPGDPPIPATTETELLRLDPRELVIVGGTAVVSTAMESALGTLLPNAAISRLAGSNRYETNTMVSETFFPVEGWASVSPSSFTTNDPTSDATQIFGNGVYSDETLMATIQLPDGAEILELRAGVYDVSADDMRIQLDYLTADGFQGVIAQAQSSGTPGSAIFASVDIDEFSRFVDNSTTAYEVLVSETSGTGSLTSTLFLRTVMVRYRLGTGGPPTS